MYLCISYLKHSIQTGILIFCLTCSRNNIQNVLCVFSYISFSDLCPFIKHPPCGFLQSQGASVARWLAAILQSRGRLAITRQIESHPVGPVAMVTAMYKLGTLQQQRSSGHHRCFLLKINTLYEYYMHSFSTCTCISHFTDFYK